MDFQELEIPKIRHFPHEFTLLSLSLCFSVADQQNSLTNAA